MTVKERAERLTALLSELDSALDCLDTLQRYAAELSETPGALARFQQRQRERRVCADCPQRDTCPRAECVRKALDPGLEEH